MALRRSWLAALGSLTIFCLGTAPSHVPTSDYWAGYAGTKAVPADTAARWLTWAETNVDGSKLIHPAGVKTLLYTDPNRQLQNNDRLWNSDESTFAHDCGGNRIEAHRRGQFLMDPHSQHLRDLWKHSVERYWNAGQFDAVFNDDANDLELIASQPCNVDRDDWLRTTIDEQRQLGRPVVYNGLEVFNGHDVSRTIGLNQSAIGGMMERCYAASPRNPKVSGWQWNATENTELQMAREGKYFFCYNNDTSPADQSLDNRLYVYASYLLTYDPRTSVLWEYYATPTRAHVMPEVQFVPFDPVRASVKRIDDLRNGKGVYVREYRNCNLNGTAVGKCIVAVNPDDSAHDIDLRGYNKMLTVSGSGIFDGGKARIDSRSLPSSLPPQSAVIAVR